MLRQVVLWQRKLLGVVFLFPSDCRRARIVRDRKRYIQKEWLLAVVVVEKVHRSVGEQSCAVRRAGLEVRLGIFAGRVEGVKLHLVLVAHATKEDRTAAVETPRVARWAIVPLADPDRVIAGLAEDLRPGWRVFDLRIHVKEPSAGEKHRPAGHTHRRLSRPLAERVREGESAGDHCIESGCFYR